MNPWGGIPAPQNKQDVNSILFSDVEFPDGVSIEWIKLYDSSVGISVFFNEYQGDLITLPSFKVLDVAFRRHTRKNKTCIQIVLRDDDMHELFFRLCLDLADSIAGGAQSNVLHRIVDRLEEWKRLLSAAQKKLSKRQQKGLIGELAFLREILLVEMGPLAAAKAWTGPTGSSRDFTKGLTFFEVKSNRGAQEHSVIISSENQLTTSAEEELFLCVIGINEDPINGLSLDSIVEDVRDAFVQDPQALAYLNSLLTLAGYSDLFDYSDTKWVKESFRYYYVDVGFPKIVPSSIPVEISEVSYRLDLSHLDEYELDEAAIRARMGC